MQLPASDDNETQLSKTQEQRAEDVFTTISPKNQAEPLRFSLSNGAHKSSGESPFPKAKSNQSGKTFEMIGEPHVETPGSDKVADQESDRLYCEAPSGQDQPNLEDTPGDIRSKSRAGILSIHEKLRTKFEMRLSPKDEKGHIYVIKDLNRPHLCKIVRSKESQFRVADLKQSCGLDLELVHYKPVDFYIRTEALIQAYLSDLCLPYFCESCDRTHSEWFEISDELAIAAVEKWVDFMCRESPYDPRSKELRPFWSMWLEVRNFASAELDVDGFRMWWDHIMSPSKLDHFYYKFKPVGEKLWKFFWPVYATLAWTVTFIALQHPVAFFLMVMSVIGTFVSMCHDFHSLRHAPT